VTFGERVASFHRATEEVELPARGNEIAREASCWAGHTLEGFRFEVEDLTVGDEFEVLLHAADHVILVPDLSAREGSARTGQLDVQGLEGPARGGATPDCAVVFEGVLAVWVVVQPAEHKKAAFVLSDAELRAAARESAIL